MTIRKGMGWIHSKPDHRNYKLNVLHTPATLPESVDLSANIDWVYDQGSENSCTGNSCASLLRFMMIKDKWMNQIHPSRNFLYWNARSFEGQTTQDAGAEMHDVVKGAGRYGAVDEQTWGYSQQTLFAKAPAAVYSLAAQNMAKLYMQVDQDRTAIQSCLASGYPFIFGFIVVSSFLSNQVASNGIVPMPTGSDKPEGGHAVCAVGYNNKSGYYKILNSWGEGWGDKGYFYLPYEYVETELSSDFWSVRTFESVKVSHAGVEVSVPVVTKPYGSC